jgi:hypothetical protein
VASAAARPGGHGGAGRRGDTAAAAELAGQAERVLLTGGVPPLLALVQLARGTAALGAGRYDEAYEQLAPIFDPQDAAYHPQVRAWALVDLAEAAAGGGYQDAARRHCAELIPEAATTGSPLLRASLAVAAPMLATDDAQALFDGLSNREIGQQLYLSHRTVRNHLYRIFPKLGITSRAELSAAVGTSPGPV